MSKMSTTEKRNSKTTTEKYGEYNEGFTISEDGTDRNNVDSWIGFVLKPVIENKDLQQLKDGGFSFVKVSNLKYNTESYLYGIDWSMGVNLTGLTNTNLRLKINENELVKEWVGIILHYGSGVKRELLNDWLERYGGGIENINEDIEMVDRMYVEDFDFEVIPNEEMMEMYPIINKVVNKRKLTNKIGNK